MRRQKVNNILNAEVVEDIIEMEKTTQNGKEIYFPTKISPTNQREIRIKPDPIYIGGFCGIPTINVGHFLSSFDRFLEGCEQGLDIIERFSQIMNYSRPKPRRR